MKELSNLKEMLEEEIRKITKKGDITPAELENMTKTVCLLEKINELEAGEMDGEYSEGYSNRTRMNNMRPMHRQSYGDDFDSYSNYASYERGRSPRTGRYVSRGIDSYSHDDYQGHNGYSGHSIRDRMISKLEEMYDDAKTDHERETVDMWIKRLETDR